MSWWLLIPAINAVLGLVAFEFMWKKTWRYRNPITELDEQFPAYRRTDAQKWRKLDFYLGAMTIMIPRLIWMSLMVMLLTLCIKIILIGAPKDGQLSGGRKACLNFWYKLIVYLIAGVTFFMRLTYQYQTLDDVHFYQEYVGNVLKRRMTRRDTLGYVRKETIDYNWLKGAEGGLIIDADS